MTRGMWIMGNIRPFPASNKSNYCASPFLSDFCTSTLFRTVQHGCFYEPSNIVPSRAIPIKSLADTQLLEYRRCGVDNEEDENAEEEEQKERRRRNADRSGNNDLRISASSSLKPSPISLCRMFNISRGIFPYFHPFFSCKIIFLTILNAKNLLTLTFFFLL